MRGIHCLVVHEQVVQRDKEEVMRMFGHSPIRSGWGDPDPDHGAQFKELPGRRAIFRRHCQTRMRSVVRYIRDPHGNIRKIGHVAWVCEVCGAREIPSPEPL